MRCHIGDCHYQDGYKKAEQRAEPIRLTLSDFGIEEERFRLEWVSAADGPRFAQVVRSFTEQVQKLGPSPYKLRIVHASMCVPKPPILASSAAL